MITQPPGKIKFLKQNLSIGSFLQYSIPIVAVIFLIANISLFLYIQVKSKKQISQTTETPPIIVLPTHTPTPTPTPYPLPQGKRSFQLGYGKQATGPKIGQITVDPFDPKNGEFQTYTLTISHAQPIVSVDLALYTDNKVVSYTLQRIEGTDIKGTWQTKIKTNDTHLYEYYAYFIVKSTVGEFRGGLTFRAY